MTTADACTQTEMTLNSIKDLEEAVTRMEKDKEELVECVKKEKILPKSLSFDTRKLPSR